MYKLATKSLYRKLMFARAKEPCMTVQVISVDGKEESRTIKTNAGPVTLSEGMWIVEYLTSPHLFVWMDGTFQQHFEAVSEKH